MAGIRDVFRRIKGLFNKNKALPEGNQKINSSINATSKEIQNLMEQKTQMFAKRNLKLYSSLNVDNMEFYENPENYNQFCVEFFRQDNNFWQQYDYVDLISQMRQDGSFNEYKYYLSYVEQNKNLYYPSQVHGIQHTSRVLLFAEMLSKLDGLSEHQRNLVMVSAQLHDIGREDDGKNFDHGEASKYKIEKFGLLNGFSKDDQDIIKFAVENHSKSREEVQDNLDKLPKKIRKDYEVVITYLQDADKLDRTRIANEKWKLDPSRLSTNTAKRLVKVAHQNFFEFPNVMNYDYLEENRDSQGLSMSDKLNIVRNAGFNITIVDLQNIISELKPGTFECLLNQGRINDLFSYETYKNFSKESEFDARLKQDYIDPDEMFKEVTKKQQTELMRETFDSEFMLYRNLKKNNQEGYDLMCYSDLDISPRVGIGLFSAISINDVERFQSVGLPFRLNDILKLSENLTPEEYQEIIRTGNLSDIFDIKHEKHQFNVDGLYKTLNSRGFNVSEEYFNRNYKLLQIIAEYNNGELLTNPRFGEFDLTEIFMAYSMLTDASNRIENGKFNTFDFIADDVYNLADYSRQTRNQVLTDEEQVENAEIIAKSRDILKDPRFIKYINKQNKPYKVKEPNDILNYNAFCADNILLDNEISLEEARSKLLHAMFDIDVPPRYMNDFESEMVNRLYFYQKYCGEDKKTADPENIIGTISEVLETTDIDNFKNKLFENKDAINRYNTQFMCNYVSEKLYEVSKQSIVDQIKETSNELDALPVVETRTSSGRNVEAKVLNGQSFNLAISVVMPRCSSVARKIMKNYGENALYSNMLNRELNPYNRCVSNISDEMLAHAASALQDQELIYGYVPTSQNDVSIMATYDMSTSKEGPNGSRITSKATTPREMSDLINGTTEEHNETVMNNVYPRYIVCFDQISDIAVKKMEKLQEEYKQKGIDQKVELVVIDAKNSYIPEIRSKTLAEHGEILAKLKEGSFSDRDFEDLFEKHESNFVLRALQTIHSTSYRDDVWDTNFNRKLLVSTVDILDKVSQVCPENKKSVLNKHIQTLLDRADRRSEYGRRVYDHAYAQQINTSRLQGIRKFLETGVRYELELGDRDTEEFDTNEVIASLNDEK